MKRRRKKVYIKWFLSYIKSDVGETSATVGVRLNVKTLNELFDSARWDERIQLAIIDEQDRILNAGGAVESLSSMRYHELEAEAIL